MLLRPAADQERHSMTERLSATLRDRFGLVNFRPGQRDALQSVLAGRDTLVVMPTGAGKSLIFQLAALHLPGVTLVVSPLIALMKNQLGVVQSVAPYEKTVLLEACDSPLNRSAPWPIRKNSSCRICSEGVSMLFMLIEQVFEQGYTQRMRSVSLREQCVPRASMPLSLKADDLAALGQTPHKLSERSADG
jgi:hypothetical protein